MISFRPGLPQRSLGDAPTQPLLRRLWQELWWHQCQSQSPHRELQFNCMLATDYLVIETNGTNGYRLQSIQVHELDR